MFSTVSFTVNCPNFKLSLTASCEKILLPSGTCAIPNLQILLAFSFKRFFPSKFIEPLLGLISPDIVCNVVVFPAPLAPMIDTTSPSFISS